VLLMQMNNEKRKDVQGLPHPCYPINNRSVGAGFKRMVLVANDQPSLTWQPQSDDRKLLYASKSDPVALSYPPSRPASG
jgi:hypothetical protein